MKSIVAKLNQNYKCRQNFSRGMKPIVKQVISIRNIKREDAKEQIKSYAMIEPAFKFSLKLFKLYGSEIYVSATQDGSMESLHQSMALLEQKFPKVFIPLQFVDLHRITKRTDYPKQLDKELVGRGIYTEYFTKIMPQQRDVYTINDNNTYVYQVDHNLKKLMVLSQMSAAYFACNDPKMNIIIAKPDPIRVIEDMALKHSLEELQQIFEKIIESIQEGILEENVPPFTDNEDIMIVVRQTAKIYHSQLFAKQVKYQSAVVHKSARLFQKLCVFVNQAQADQLTNASQGQPIEYNQIFTHTDSEGQDKTELLEKIVICGYFYDFTLRLYAVQGQNPFQHSLFKDVFTAEDIPQFLQMHEKYNLKLNHLQNFLIKYILTQPLEQKKIVKYGTRVAEFEQKAKYWKHEFEIQQTTKLKQQAVLNNLLKQQMGKLITNRRLQGINQKDIIKSLQAIQDDDFGQKDLSNYMKLIMESNALLGYPIKFPEQMKKQFLPYIHNLQVERVSKDVAGITIHQLEKNIFYMKQGEKKKKQINENELTDEEDWSDKDNDNNSTLIVGDQKNLENSDNVKNVQNMSYEELLEKGERIATLRIDQDEHGEMTLIPEQINTQLDIDQLIKDGGEDLNKGKLDDINESD